MHDIDRLPYSSIFGKGATQKPETEIAKKVLRPSCFISIIFTGRQPAKTQKEKGDCRHGQSDGAYT